jgi:preprotein translocase subunit SecA
MHDIQSTFTERFLKIQVSAERPEPPRAPPRPPTAVSHPAAPTSGADDLFMGPPPRVPPPPAPGTRGPAPAVTSSLGPIGRATAAVPEVGRNDPCPCGSGKKYKKCHGAGR